MTSDKVDRISKMILPVFLAFLLGGSFRQHVPEAYPYVLMGILTAWPILLIWYVSIREAEIKAALTNQCTRITNSAIKEPTEASKDAGNQGQ